MQKRIHFDNRLGHKLAGILHLPDTQDVSAYALFAHCFTCTKNINSATNIAEALSNNGIATLRFDFTGLGASKGDFSDSTFTTNVNDLLDAADYLQEHYEAPQLLVGHSLGGTAILAAANDIPSARAVASIGSPANPEHILHLLESQLETIANEGAANIDLAGRPFTFKQVFVDDVQAHEINLRRLGKALMVMHSPVDETVSIDEAGKIFSQAMHPKSFVSLDRADHLLSKMEDSRYVGEMLTQWSMRFIEASSTAEEAGEDHVTVSADTERGFLCRMRAGSHHLVADEPKSIGGTDLGPTPYDLLAGSLGTCTAMTLNMYARHKKIAVSNVTVQVEHGRIHADDCADCETKDGHVDVLTRSIEIKGALNEEERQRMLEIADRCPVHKTLENEIKIVSKLSDL